MALFRTEKEASDYRTYYLRVPVRSYWWESVRGEQTFGRTPTKPVPTIAQELAAVKGIQTFYTHEGYELKLHKAASYTWKELEAQIDAIVDKHDSGAEWPAPQELETIFPQPSDNHEDESDYTDYAD